MGVEYLEVSELTERIAFAATGEGRPVTFLLGSASSLPRGRGSPGVPGVREIVELVAARLGTELGNATYQEAFEKLVQSQGLDAANDVIQEAVLRARKASPPNRPKTRDDFAKIEEDASGWTIPSGIHSLASLVSHHPRQFGGTILTTNFDPLIEVALCRMQTPWYSTSLHADGSLLYIRGTGTHVVHLHGHWWGSDTLHTPAQLKAERPQLVESVRALLGETTLVVVGYGGWDDVFMSALVQAARANSVRPDILWAFHPQQAVDIEKQNARVLATLEEIPQARRLLYRGVDVDDLLRDTLTRALHVRPAESLTRYCERVALLRTGTVSLPPHIGMWSPNSSLGEFVKALHHFGKELPAYAAACLARYHLPRLENQPIHQAPQARAFHWLRQTIRAALEVLAARTNVGVSRLRADIERISRASQQHPRDSFEWFAIEACGDALSSVMAKVLNREYGKPDAPHVTFSSEVWAAKSVHLSTRALHNDERAAWGYITDCLASNRDHL